MPSRTAHTGATRQGAGTSATPRRTTPSRTGRRHVVLRLGGAVLRLERRALSIAAALVALILVISVTGTLIGD